MTYETTVFSFAEVITYLGSYLLKGYLIYDSNYLARTMFIARCNGNNPKIGR